MKRLLLSLIFILLAATSVLAQATPTATPTPTAFDFPSSPTVGQQVTGPDGQIYVWDGTKWVHVAGGVAGFVPLSGGTMTGALILSGNAAMPLQAVPLQQLNSAIGALGTGPFAPLVNPVGGQNNYAPIASPALTGTVGIGQSPPTSPTLLGMTANVNGNTSLSVLNNSTGAAAQALFDWSNGTDQLFVGINGSNFVPAVGQGNAQAARGAVMLAVAPGGYYIGNFVAHGATKFFSNDGSGSTSEGYFDDTGWHLPTLALTTTGLVLTPSTGASTIWWGSTTQPFGTIYGYDQPSGAPQVTITSGAHSTPGAIIADNAQAAILAINAGPTNIGIGIYGNTGLTVGSAFTPTLIAELLPTGMTVNGAPVATEGAWQSLAPYVNTALWKNDASLVGRFRRVGTSVQVEFYIEPITAHVLAASGELLFTLPAGYRPAFDIGIPITAQRSTDNVMVVAKLYQGASANQVIVGSVPPDVAIARLSGTFFMGL